MITMKWIPTVSDLVRETLLDMPSDINNENICKISRKMKLANLESISFIAEPIVDAQTFVVKSDQFFVPMANDEDPAVLKAESAKELEYLIGFKKSVEAKLANERFVQNAKAELVERERQKLSDAENKIKSLQELLARLG